MLDDIVRAFKDSLNGMEPHHLNHIIHHAPGWHPPIVPEPLPIIFQSIGFITEMCNYLMTILPIGVWNGFEIFLGLLVFCLAGVSRVVLTHFSSKCPNRWYVTKMGQLGLWLQGLSGIVAFVDGMINIIIEQHRISLSIVMLSMVLVSVSYLLGKHVDFKKVVL